MQMVSKDELKGILSYLEKDQIIELLHDAWSDLYYIEKRATSHWVYREAFFKEGSWCKQWKEIMKKSNGKDLNND